MTEKVRTAGGAFTDSDGLITDSFLEYISRGKYSEHTLAKIEQIKEMAKDTPETAKLLEFVFKIGYGTCVWDHEIGLDKKD